MICNAAFSQVFAYDHLYVVGNACSAGWSTGGALEMTETNSGSGIFTWTGILLDKTEDGGKRRFKFLTARDWANSITVGDPNSENKTITLGEEEALRVNTSGNDNAFQVETNAVYDVMVNTNDMTMTCTLNSDDRKLTEIQIVGGAIPIGWNGGDYQMTKLSDCEFVYPCRLAYNGDNNDSRIKFRQNHAWGDNINPTGNIAFVPNTEYDLTYKASEDYKFIVTEATAGYYEVHVDLLAMKAWFVKMPNVISSVYLIGTATSAGYDWATNLQMTEFAPDVYAWTGNLNVGELKFLTQRQTWDKNLNPKTAINPVVLNTEYDLEYRPKNVAPPADNKLVFSEAGAYTVIININTMKITVSEPITVLTGSTDVATYTTGDIVFGEGGELTGATNQTVAGVVKVVKTFDTNKWYPIGFPFEIDNINVQYNATSKPGVVYTGNTGNEIANFSNNGGESDNFFVAEYDGADNKFKFTNSIGINKGYIVEFPKSDYADANSVTVTFTSTASPTLNSLAGKVTYTSDESNYTMVANPNVADVTSVSDGVDAAAFYYQFDYWADAENYPNGRYNLVNATTLNTALKPFEAIIAVNSANAPEKVIGAGNVITSINNKGLQTLVNDNDPIVETQYYNLQGVRVASSGKGLQSLVSGIYIVKEIYKSGKTSAGKSIIR
jgi:hypothetical protein